MLYMKQVLESPELPDDCGIAIEYQIPQSGKRIDILVSGQGHDRQDNLVIVELKQWTSAAATGQDGIVITAMRGGQVSTTHPSYQAWSYASLLRDFNETVEVERIGLHPCAYLHNCRDGSGVLDPRYGEYLNLAPIFLSGQALRLRRFLSERICHGDRDGMLHRIESGRVRPSKTLADSVLAMLQGNPEFTLIDEQKLVFEQAFAMAKEATAKSKQVLIVRGGPGTGKSVVAINLLARLTNLQIAAQYVSKNSAPREVYASKLIGSFRKSHVQNLFRGSGTFVGSKPHSMQALIVDEAHRLNEKSGLYGNLGENQIKEIISATTCAIFFIDEDQRIAMSDVGTVEEIRSHADRAKASIIEMDLPSQFRCNGSDGYLAWLDNTLGIRETANVYGTEHGFDFRVFTSPTDLRDTIFTKNETSNRARLVAGYCWKWKSKKDREAHDIEFPGTDFKMRWNLTDDGSLWIMKPDSVNEVGCIHTCQGLEVDYIGVIVGPDLIYRNGEVQVVPQARDRSDKTIKGWKKLSKENPVEAKKRLNAIIRNTYRTLMTRGMKGCYVYCVDPALGEYLESRMARPSTG